MIGLDIYRNKGVGPGQECLRRQARTNPRLVSIFNAAESIGPIPGTPSNRQAFNDLVVDADGVVRRDLVHVSGQDAATVALPLRLVEVFRGNGELRRRFETNPHAGSWLERDSGGYFNQDSAGFQQMQAFHQSGSFPVWSLDQLLKREGSEAADQGSNRVDRQHSPLPAGSVQRTLHPLRAGSPSDADARRGTSCQPHRIPAGPR